MQDSKTPPPDELDRVWAEIKRLKWSVSFLSVLCFLQAIRLFSIGRKITQIYDILALCAQSIQLITDNLSSIYEVFVKLNNLI